MSPLRPQAAPVHLQATVGAAAGEAHPQHAQSCSSRFRRARLEQRTDLAQTGNAAPGSSRGNAAQCVPSQEKLHAPDRTTPAGRLSRPRSWSRPWCRGRKRARLKAFRTAPRQTRKCRCEDPRDLPFATTSWCANIAETSGSTPNQVKAPHFLSESQFFLILIQETRSDVRYRCHPTPERQTQDPFRRRDRKSTRL